MLAACPYVLLHPHRVACTAAHIPLPQTLHAHMCVQVVSMRADQDYEVMRGVRAAGFPLHVVLERLSGSTRGWCRRLDLGRARAFAEPIDLQPLLQQK